MKSCLLSPTLANNGAAIGIADAWNTRSAHVLELGLATMAVDIVPRWFGPTTRVQQSSLILGWRVILSRGDDRGYALFCELLGRSDISELTFAPNKVNQCLEHRVEG